MLSHRSCSGPNVPGAVAALLGLTVACAGPSREALEAQRAATERLRSAHAVHLPPDDRDSCVGITIRLSDRSATSEAERVRLATRVTAEEVSVALSESGLARCTARFDDERSALGLGPEPGYVELGYGVDPEGRVCAVVQHERPDLLDPRADALASAAAQCAKDALFRARFPSERVEGLERVVLLARLPLLPPRSSDLSAARSASEPLRPAPEETAVTSGDDGLGGAP